MYTIRIGENNLALFCGGGGKGEGWRAHDISKLIKQCVTIGIVCYIYQAKNLKVLGGKLLSII